MRRVALATGAEVILALPDLDSTDFLPPHSLGNAGLVYEEQVADHDILVFRDCAMKRAATLLLRGANDLILDEIERSLHDSLCVAKRVIEGKSVVPGGGAVEVCVATFLESFAISVTPKAQHPILEFADALLIIPKTLAMNSGQDVAEVMAKLLSQYHLFHDNARYDKSPTHLNLGLD